MLVKDHYKRSKSENSVTSRTYRPRTSPNTSPAESKIFSIDHCSFPPVRRLVCIGDIHGDLMATIKALKLAGVIDVNIPNNTQDITRIHWKGGNTYVVQLGDQIDRVRPSLFNSLCPLDDPDIVEDEGSDLKIITLFNRLHYEALKSGGACLSVLCNHELMNVEGDFNMFLQRNSVNLVIFSKQINLNVTQMFRMDFENDKNVLDQAEH